MNLGDEHMTDETRDIYRAKVAERQAAEDALVQKRIEAASEYVGTRVETNRESGSRGTGIARNASRMSTRRSARSRRNEKPSCAT